ncbi:hypothetical protein AB0937_28890 [Streptomyces sp. NPDC047880]|uniref:hypothetical protein n=1 Tax=Streptomyces sp. NPDC047880 TaxID=3155626 RepID=UPI0034558DBB
MRSVRRAKGAVTVAVATAACHALMTAGYAWARGKAATDEATMFAGAFEWLVTTAASWALMPLLLGAGMRVLREHGNTALMVGGGLIWAVLSLAFADEIDRPGGFMPLPALAVWVLAGTGLAGAGAGRRRGRPPGPTAR